MSERKWINTISLINEKHIPKTPGWNNDVYNTPASRFKYGTGIKCTNHYTQIEILNNCLDYE